ncbi:hypothetical protein [Neptunicoccus sediminis]|uniref:hypothetical protein n=1 Tax=Neptunicoccus sediminis TaxID=1892596 RepID=UPI000845E180|nr:hypothetical protein [Neptunicoccus sediminis]
MDFRLHIGVHRSATQHLRKMLWQNRDLLQSQGICVPLADQAERAFARAIKQISRGATPRDVKAELVSALTKDQSYRRVVMIDPSISGTLMRPVGKEYFYPRIATTMSRILNVLNGESLRVFVGLRNPASFIPSCYCAGMRHNPALSFEDFVADANLQGLRWSDYLHRAQLKKADLPITTWRYEDYPLMWRDVAQALTGIKNRELLVGSSAPVNSGLSLRGAILMHSYLKEHPVGTRAEFEKLNRAFDRKFPSTQGFNDELHWPEELTEGMTENYEDDLYYIERMDNVMMLSPERYD